MSRIAANTRPRTLMLPVLAKYFLAIREGRKPLEFRLRNEFWTQRLVGKSYDRVVVTLGYPKANDASRRIELPWRGYLEQTIVSEHFGKDAVNVFAIHVDIREQFVPSGPLTAEAPVLA